MLHARSSDRRRVTPKPISDRRRTEPSQKASSPVLRSQQAVGNRVTRQLVWTKLRINRPDDPFEREANRMAEWVVRTWNAPGASQLPLVQEPFAAKAPHNQSVQRLAGYRSPALSDSEVAREDEEERPSPAQVQRLRSDGASGKSQSQPREGASPLSKRLASSRNQGFSLSHAVRTSMEGRLGFDFSRVRIHTDAQAARLSDSLQARAFTYGRHVYFSRGEYRPDVESGRHLLAHELTHVIQQGRAERVSGESIAFPVGLPTSMVSPAIQRMSAPGGVIRNRVRPWGGYSPEGTDHEVFTDAGTRLSGWIAYSPYRVRYRYWCHGHSLGTYDRYGYSVYSRAPMRTVIREEYNPVPTASIRAGDLAVWTNRFDHSAIFTSPALSGGQLDPNRTGLSSKNGDAPLDRHATLTGLAGSYGPTGIRAYRHK